MHCQPLRDLLVNICSKFNQPCYFCAARSDNPYPLCSGCEADLPWVRSACECCALPLTFEGPCCRHCEWSPPPFTCAQAPWAYDFPLDAAIKGLKHRDDRAMGRLLTERLAVWLAYRYTEGLAPPQYLVPVPLSAKRLRARGFNQAQLIAQWLTARLAIPTARHLLRRTRHTDAQQGLDLAARQRNLQGAFRLAPHAQVEGLHLALIDDVLTTGATARALTQILKSAGARRVDVYCLARTPAVGPG